MLGSKDVGKCSFAGMIKMAISACQGFGSMVVYGMLLRINERLEPVSETYETRQHHSRDCGGAMDYFTRKTAQVAMLPHSTMPASAIRLSTKGDALR